jgi:hypothetical protein
VLVILVEAGLEGAVVGDFDYHPIRKKPGGYLHFARRVLDGIGSSFGDGYLEIEDAIIGKRGGASDLFHEPPGFGELGKVGRDEKTEEPILLFGPRGFGHRVLACERDRGLVEIRKHPKVGSSGQSHDLEEPKEVGGGSYDAKPAALAHVPDR